ncbi:sensor histidine kinase [Glaciibacter superstes]|uniref:sensor histidine kinase n=1 Tax=Glaciibacter superstes TaxID=501023 RepID=UPI000419FE37|nr:ATP-binding protein [Glaciibacter superstes]
MKRPEARAEPLADEAAAEADTTPAGPRLFRPGLARAPHNPISRQQIETVLYRCVAVIALIFSLQATPVFLAQLPYRKRDLALIGAAIYVIALVGLVVTAVLKSGVRIAATVLASYYVAALLLWSPLMIDSAVKMDGKPYLWYLCTIATTCAAVAFRPLWAAIYTVVVPLVYGVVRTLPSGGGADPLLASLDVAYAIILGEVALIIIYLLRQTTAAVDLAQSNALRKYGAAVRQHATELERVQVDAIVHDSVLTTLLSAANAHSPKESELAATMARNAIARLDEAGAVRTDDDTMIGFHRLRSRIRDAAMAFARPFEIMEHDIDSFAIPLQASEALYSAAVQAMVNSMQHAGPADATVSRTLTIRPNLQGGCTIEIADTGIGFDPESVPSERLGLRVSIQERVNSVGGRVHVRTGIGQGTAIMIEWPRTDGDLHPFADQFSADEIPVLGLDHSQPQGGDRG